MTSEYKTYEIRVPTSDQCAKLIDELAQNERISVNPVF